MGSQELEKLYNFDESDLYANRNGYLSQKQEQRLIQEAKSAKIPSIGCGLLFFGIASIFPIAFAPLALSSLDNIGALIGIAIAVLVWTLVWGLIGVFMIRSAFAKPNLTLQKAEGPVNIVGVERTSSGEDHHTYIAHELHVGGGEFDVDSGIADYIMQGDVYAIYFLKDTDTILSLERLS
jgi:hypothetical protein